MQWWAINNSNNGNIQYPNCREAQKILEDNIFGFDTKQTATLVSVFGLTTALLDKLSPQEIWNNFKFKDLSKNNIQNSIFFEWAVNAQRKALSFDFSNWESPFQFRNRQEKRRSIDAPGCRRFKFTA